VSCLPTESNRKIERVVIKLSGSLFESDIEKSDLKPYIKIFSDLRNKGLKMVLVAGGGKNARRYITAARTMGADESSLDEIGIIISRLNALLMIAGFGRLVKQYVPTTLGEVAKAFDEKGLVVTGGLHPGQSTNATASLIAERIGADLFLNATSVDGVYTGNPKKDANTEKLSTVTVEKLSEILSNSGMSAGTYELMDMVALKIIERSNIPTRLVICSPDVIVNVLEGSQDGTQILLR